MMTTAATELLESSKPFTKSEMRNTLLRLGITNFHRALTCSIYGSQVFNLLVSSAQPTAQYAHPKRQ